MSITFEHVINLTTYGGNSPPPYVGSLMIANEPDNEINQFYIYKDHARDKSSQVDYSNYPELQWTDPATRMTNQYVKRIGIKSFPQIGAMAFYSLKYEERSFFLCPLFIDKERFTRPEFRIEQNETSLVFHMKSPKDITYTCWRVILRCGDTAFEYISYEDTLTVDNPYLTGTYDCYCVGYVGEGESVSDDSEHFTLNIIGTGEDPLDKFEFYTKAELDNSFYTREQIDMLVKSILDQTGRVSRVVSVMLLAAAWVGDNGHYTQIIQIDGVTANSKIDLQLAADQFNEMKKLNVSLMAINVGGTITVHAIGDRPNNDCTIQATITEVSR